MAIINLRDLYYWYTQDEYMEVSDDVAEALRASVRYDEMQSVNIGAVSVDALADVSGMAFDLTLPKKEKQARFIQRVVNPYCFNVGGVGVKIEFAENGPSLQEMLTAFFIWQRNGL